MSWNDARRDRQRAQIRRVKPERRVGATKGRRFNTDALREAWTPVKVRW